MSSNKYYPVKLNNPLISVQLILKEYTGSIKYWWIFRNNDIIVTAGILEIRWHRIYKADPFAQMK